MGSVIDTSIFIAAERGKLDPDALMDEIGDGLIAIAAVTCSELLEGTHLGNDPADRAERAAFAEGVILSCDVLDHDLRVARVHGRLLGELKRLGTPVGAHDLIIAATAIAHGLRVVTRDAKSFPRIPGLAYLLK